MGVSPVKYDAHNIPVCRPREVSPTIIKVTFIHFSIRPRLGGRCSIGQFVFSWPL
jgi:hypothetical protein